MYRLNYTPEFQVESGYRQDCNLLFADFIDAIKHVRDTAIMMYPELQYITFRGIFDKYGNFRIRIPTNCYARLKIPPIAVITLT